MRSVLESVNVCGGLRVRKSAVEGNVVNVVMIKELRENLEDFSER